MADKKPQYCKRCEANGKQVEIKFDNEHKSQAGKPYPVEVATGSGHNCPYSDYAMAKNSNAGSSPFAQFTNPSPQINQNIPTVHTARTIPKAELFALLDSITVDVAKLRTLIGGLP